MFFSSSPDDLRDHKYTGSFVGESLTAPQSIVFPFVGNTSEVPTWIINGSGTLSLCTIADQLSPVLNNCTLNTPINFSARASGSQYAFFGTVDTQFLFTLNTDNTISTCLINNTTQAFTSCTSQSSLGLNDPNSMYVSTWNFYVLITNRGNDTVKRCNIEPTLGIISNCRSTGSGFNAPAGIFVDGNSAYIANSGENSISYCKIDNNGNLSNCSKMSFGFNKPVSVYASGGPCG